MAESKDAPRRGTATVAQLRDDIDSGRTRDKVPASDPAAAPLGTDNEAAGTPPPAELVQRARTAEATARGEPAGTATAASGRQPVGDRGMIPPVVIAFIAIALAAAAIFMLLR